MLWGVLPKLDPEFQDKEGPVVMLYVVTYLTSTRWLAIQAAATEGAAVAENNTIPFLWGLVKFNLYQTKRRIVATASTAVYAAAALPHVVNTAMLAGLY